MNGWRGLPLLLGKGGWTATWVAVTTEQRPFVAAAEGGSMEAWRPASMVKEERRKLRKKKETAQELK
jgi:hypothetical protein